MKKNQNGITLIALVITIIVLLILAGIAINAIAGEDGILTKATQAKNNWNDASGKEEDSLGFLTQKINQYTEGINWEYIYNDANNNPEKYIHPEQSNTNGDIGIGTDGLPVNMDLWDFQVKDGSYIELCKARGCNFIPGYSNENIIDGKIQGKVPQYIKKAGTDVFLPVIDMAGTFYGCSNLVEAPILPDIVTTMYCTFYDCDNLEKISNFPSQVQKLKLTFGNCVSLISVPKIPNSAEEMSYTFENCTNLKTVPNIPKKVTSLYGTFHNCANLTGTINIQANFSDCSLTFFNASTAPGAELIITGASDEVYNILIATKSENSNIKRWQ